MQLQTAALAVLFMIHGTSADCDGTDANVLIDRIGQFNVMLNSFAGLGSSVLAASATPTAKAKKSGGHLLKREPTATAHAVAKSRSHGAVRSHGSNKAAAASQNSEPQQELQKQLQKSYHALKKQQSQLDSLSDSCIPSLHKLKVISQITSMLDTYIDKDKQLKAAGQRIVEKKTVGGSSSGNRGSNGSNKNKRSPEEKEQRKQERHLRRRDIVRRSLAREQHDAPDNSPAKAGWLTMEDGVNTGYNDDESELTATSADSSTTTSQVYASYAPYQYNTPQLVPQYVTVTSTGSVEVTPAAAAPSYHGKQKESDSASGSESDSASGSGSDTGSDDDSSETTVSTAAAPLQTTKAHHNIIVGTIDGAYHLVTGSLHLVRSLLHSILLVDDKQTVSGNDISKLVDHAKKIYNVKR